jgi:predicted SAM-dependent methyltransferase
MIEIKGVSYSKLNLGCGRDLMKKLPPPWLNVDLEGVAADFLSDVHHLPPAWSEAVDEVRASHLLEHFFLNEMGAVLQEWFRVLVPGGVLRVIVPDLEIITEALRKGVDSKGRRSISVTETTPILAQIYGIRYEDSETEKPWRHRFLFNEDILKELLLQQGFQDAERYDQSEDPAKHHRVKDDSQNPFSLCVVARKPKRR